MYWSVVHEGLNAEEWWSSDRLGVSRTKQWIRNNRVQSIKSCGDRQVNIWAYSTNHGQHGHTALSLMLPPNKEMMRIDLEWMDTRLFMVWHLLCFSFSDKANLSGMQDECVSKTYPIMSDIFSLIPTMLVNKVKWAQNVQLVKSEARRQGNVFS